MESVDKLREWSKRYDYHWIDPKTGEMITFYPIDGESLPSGKNERFSVNEGERMRELLDEIEREHQREVNKEVMDMFYMPNNRVALPDLSMLTERQSLTLHIPQQSRAWKWLIMQPMLIRFAMYMIRAANMII